MKHFLKSAIFFILGAILTLIVIISVTYLAFTAAYKNKIYPGVKIAGQTPPNLDFDFSNLQFNFSNPNATISASGKEINLRPDLDLMKKRALSVGRQTANPYYNFLQIVAAANGKINLPVEVSFDETVLDGKIDVAAALVEKKPVDAVYQFVPGAGPDGRGRVTAFAPSENGLAIDREKIKKIVRELRSGEYILPTNVVLPVVSTTTADNLGIKNLLGRGESYFYDSIPGRIYNVGLGANKINGSLIAPNEVFSFSNSIGTVSAVFGFQKAYAIVKGKTTLDDGGGVCQVSTTLYRAVLNAGLPVVERHAHSYRVGFYEQGGFAPGTDATVYPPSPDFRFLNDTGGWILVQTNFDQNNRKLTFDLFGTSDGRQTNVSGPFIISTSPPPEPIYEDDPNLPAGEVKQVDTAHYGAKTYFKRVVIRNGVTLIDETVYSDYVPWPARFLKGTKT
jgi:vancomycin resistance protein YoaR